MGAYDRMLCLCAAEQAEDLNPFTGTVLESDRGLHARAKLLPLDFLREVVEFAIPLGVAAELNPLNGRSLAEGRGGERASPDLPKLRSDRHDPILRSGRSSGQELRLALFGGVDCLPSITSDCSRSRAKVVVGRVS